jgi:hypothetical protein
MKDWPSVALSRKKCYLLVATTTYSRIRVLHSILIPILAPFIELVVELLFEAC